MDNRDLNNTRDHSLKVGEAVKRASISAALRGLEEASMSGLCGEGALENAIGAIKMLDVQKIIDEITRES